MNCLINFDCDTYNITTMELDTIVCLCRHLQDIPKSGKFRKGECIISYHYIRKYNTLSITKIETINWRYDI